jgi:hypothetical protein
MSMKTLPDLLLSLFAGAAVAADACPNAGSMGFACGPESPEDLVRIGTSRWLVGDSRRPLPAY